jgi:hypothetical protein
VEHAVAGDAGVVDQDLDGPVIRLDGADAGLAARRVRHVELVDRNASLVLG